jgi:hypothetical protein
MTVTMRNTLAGDPDIRRNMRMTSGIDIASSQEVSAEPVTVGEVTVTPRARALVVRLPWGGFVWSRPTTVLVERAGELRRHRVVDVTRVLQLGVLGLGLASAAAIARRSHAERR